MKEKSFITLTPGLNLIKFFSASLMLWENTEMRLFPLSNFGRELLLKGKVQYNNLAILNQNKDAYTSSNLD